MDQKILVATPDRDFGEEIKQALEEEDYSPLLTSNTAEAAFLVQFEKCPIAILDSELPNPGPKYLAAELRSYVNDLRIILIHPDDGRVDQIDNNSTFDISLPRPFKPSIKVNN